MALQFKIQLKNITSPPVWRRVIVPDTFSFHDLHLVIQAAFPWDNYHLYMFNPKGYSSHPTISLPSDGWEETEMNAKRTFLTKIFYTEKQTFTYIYDFGDDWTHHIVLEKILPEKVIYPMCLAGKGKCPPEDCGGPWGYENLKETLSDPNSEEHEEMKEWLGLEEGEEWEADFFDLDETNIKLQAFFTKLEKRDKNRQKE
jgi:hypothetical protein